MQDTSESTRKPYSFITVALVATVMFAFMLSCSHGKEEYVASFTDKEKIPTVKSLDVHTLISDSGITRYRIKTKEWLMYDNAKEPYWYFPYRIYVEKFDSLFNTEAFIEADTAYFYTSKKLWILRGNVEMRNVDQQHFSTSELYWNQRMQRIYSPAFIRIEKEDQFLEGYGFESNEQMTEYVIRHPGPGDFTPKQRPADSTAVATDSTAVLPDSIHSSAAPSADTLNTKSN